MIFRFTYILLALLGSAALLSSTRAEAPDAAQRYQELFRDIATPLTGPEDLSPLFEAIGDRRVVLLGESTHGTEDYYHWRAVISRHLVEHKGFDFIGVEGDWTAIYPLNRYIKGHKPEHTTARDVMRASVTRWPQWMWANESFAEFVEWLRDFNAEREPDDQVGLYGLDMQDPEGAMEQVLAWFEANDDQAHPEVAEAYQQITRFPDSFRSYARHLARGGERLDDSLRQPVTRLQEAADGAASEADKDLWVALQNALAVKRAEAQFHAAISRGPESWNARARFMHEAYLRIAERHGDAGKGMVWAHNTHVGDSRATDMRNRGEVNIGKLMRTSEGEDDVFILGFSTHHGNVVAASEWDGEREIMTIVPAHPQSVEALLKDSGLQQHLLIFDRRARQADLRVPMHHRAIGVIYRPPQEAYVPSVITLRYDALIHIDETRALVPLAD